MADRLEMFGPTRGFPGMAGTMQKAVGPTFVAMATKFGLGAEIQSPTGLFDLLLCAHKQQIASSLIRYNSSKKFMFLISGKWYH